MGFQVPTLRIRNRMPSQKRPQLMCERLSKTLPEEVLAQIFECVVQQGSSCRSTLHSASLVSRHWNSSANAFLYQIIEPTSTKCLHLLIRTITHSPHLSSLVRQVYRPLLCYPFLPGPWWRTQMVYLDGLHQREQVSRMSQNDYLELMQAIDTLSKRCRRVDRMQVQCNLSRGRIVPSFQPADVFNAHILSQLRCLTLSLVPGYNHDAFPRFPPVSLPALETIILDGISVPPWFLVTHPPPESKPNYYWNMYCPNLSTLILRKCAFPQAVFDLVFSHLLGQVELHSIFVEETRFFLDGLGWRPFPWIGHTTNWKSHYGNLRFLSLDSMRGFRFHRNALVQLESLEILEIFISDSCHLLRAEQFPPSMHTLVIRFSTRRPAPYEPLEILGSLSKFIDDVATPHCSIKRIDLSWPFADHRTDLGTLSLLCSCLKEKCRRRGIKLQIESVPAAWSPPVLEFNYQSKYDRWARPQGRILRMADAALRKIRR